MPDKHVAARLKREHVIWLVTVGRDSHPHGVPVWFWWDGDSFLVYSVPGQKVNDIRANSNVHLHLNTDSEGDGVVRIEGSARIGRGEPPAFKVPGYVRKYRALIRGLDMTPQSFSEQYSVPIRIRPTRFH